MDSDIKNLLDQAAVLTQAVGRQLKSPKLDVDGMTHLEDTLNSIKSILRSAKVITIIRNS